MASKKYLLPGLLIAAAGFFLYRRGTSAKNLQFRAEKLGFVNFNLLNTTLRFTAVIVNPSPFPVNVRSFGGEIIANGASVGAFSKLDNLNIRGRATAQVVTEVNLSNFNAVRNVLRPYFQGKPVNLTIKGTIFLPEGPVPFETNVQLTK